MVGVVRERHRHLSVAGAEPWPVSGSPTLPRVIVRMAEVADVATLAEFQDIGPDKLAAFADWVAAHARTHLPFVAEADGFVVGAALMAAILAEARTRHLSHVTVHSGQRAVDFFLRSGFSHHRRLLLWEPVAL